MSLRCLEEALLRLASLHLREIVDCFTATVGIHAILYGWLFRGICRWSVHRVKEQSRLASLLHPFLHSQSLILASFIEALLVALIYLLSMASIALLPSSLPSKLAAAFPCGTAMSLYHISTPPTKCAALYHPPKGSKPERTFCESHFLAFAIDPDHATKENGNKSSQMLVFAIEALIYTTSSLTTLFVSKADSTGFLHLLPRPKDGSPSLLKTISTTVIAHLVDTHRRPGVNLVVSLFARSQGQYLFPGSVENDTKHVLDDRGLIKWWCRVLDPLARQDTRPHPASDLGDEDGEESEVSTKAYLIAPGLDKYETSFLFPPSSRSDPADGKIWVNSYPLPELSKNPTAAPRCLIPHFPDDPKARFLDELDDEIIQPSKYEVDRSPSKVKTDMWKSIKSLTQFWDAMEFRQECSSGRMVGFIWVVFKPHNPIPDRDQFGDSQPSMLSVAENAEFPSTPDKDQYGESQASLVSVTENTELPPTPVDSQQRDTLTTVAKLEPEVNKASNMMLSPQVSPSKFSDNFPASQESAISTSSRVSASTKLKKRPLRGPTIARGEKRTKLTGPIISRAPRIKSASATNSSLIKDTPVRSRYFLWQESGRGSLVLAAKDYNRVTELVLRLDFAGTELAASSTSRWVDEVAAMGGLTSTSTWEVEIVGQNTGSGAAVNANGNEKRTGDALDGEEPANTVVITTLSTRKKPKLSGGDGDAPKALDGSAAPVVNVLGTSMIRKKPKASESSVAAAAPAVGDAGNGGGINVLGTGLVRKKPKV